MRTSVSPQHRREVLELGARQIGDARVRRARRDVRLVRIAREVRHECQRARSLRRRACAGRPLLRRDDVLEQRAAVLGEMRRRRLGLDLDGAEDEVRRVDLRSADADCSRRRPRPCSRTSSTWRTSGRPPARDTAPASVVEQPHDLVVRQLGEREVVARRVAHDARDPVGAAVPIDRSAIGRRRRAPSAPTHGWSLSNTNTPV